MRRSRLWALPAVVLAVTACQGGQSADAPPTIASTHTRTIRPSPAETGPVDVRPTTAADAVTCPILMTQTAADTTGMRLARVQILRQGGTTIRCRFYALQGTPLATSDTEIVDTQPPPAGAGFPTAEYGTALGVKLTDGSWHDIAHGRFFHTSDAVCPPYHLQVLGSEDVETYRSLATSNCWNNGDQVW